MFAFWSAPSCGSSFCARLTTRGARLMRARSARRRCERGRPSWLPRFSVAADYYKIDMSGSIVLVSGLVAQTQSVCEASNGASPLCALYFRPLPFSNRTAANYPTLVLAQPQNIARTWTDGVDFEVNYGLALNELRSSLPGWLNLRLLASYQPDLDTVLYPGQPVVNTAGTVSVAPGATVAMAVPAVKFSLGASYLVGPWTLATQVRWRSSLALNGDPTVAFDGPSIPANAVADLTAVYKFNVGTKAFEAFVTVQNLFDQLARSYASTVQVANFGGGNTIMPVPDISGGAGATYLTAKMFVYEWGGQICNRAPRHGLFVTNASTIQV